MTEEQSPTATIAYNLNFETGELTWSDALYTACGYDHTEPAGTTEWWSEHIHPNDAMLLNQAMDKLLDPAVREWTVAYRFRRADNVYVPVQDHAIVVRNENGEAIRLTGSLVLTAQ